MLALRLIDRQRLNFWTASSPPDTAWPLITLPREPHLQPAVDVALPTVHWCILVRADNSFGPQRCLGRSKAPANYQSWYQKFTDAVRIAMPRYPVRTTSRLSQAHTVTALSLICRPIHPLPALGAVRHDFEPWKSGSYPCSHASGTFTVIMSILLHCHDRRCEKGFCRR